MMTPISGNGWICVPADLRPPSVSKEQFAEFPGLQIKEKSDGSWMIKTIEEYANLPKPGFKIKLVARGSQFESTGLDRLNQLLPITNSTPRDQLEQFAEARRRQATFRVDEEPLWSRFAGDLQISLDEDLESKLRGLQSEGQDSDSLWLVEADTLLSRRLAFMRMLFAQKHTRDAVDAVDFVGFPAARALMVHTAAGFTMYFSPLLLLDAPFVNGFSVARPNATIIRLLTVSEPGRQRGWTDQLDSFKPSYASSRVWLETIVPNTTLETREVMLRWWAGRLSELLWVITDPTRHTDGSGNYDPSVHLGVTLTVERLFVTSIEIMCHKTKDELLRKLLLFDFLDLLEGHGMGTYEKNLSYKKQYALWSTLKESLPEEIAVAFSPVIEGAFEALLHLETGFWSSANRTSKNEILINRRDGTGTDAISLDRARGEYLRILRNSTHGFKDLASDPRNLSYLANHTAELHENLADLVWWYLIRLLSTPSEVSPLNASKGSYARGTIAV